MKRIVAPTDPAVNLKIVLRPVARKQLGDICAATEYRLGQTDPDFPRRVEVSPGLTGYFQHELDEYLAKKMAQRDAGHKPSIVLVGERVGRSGRGGRPRKAPDPRQLDLEELPRTRSE
jgi:predicted DNA-binding transcriptional regulator AlpA